MTAVYSGYSLNVNFGEGVMSKLVALLTDFGTRDSYVGVMKAVMRSIMPTLDFIDITHAVAPQSVRGGAIALMNSYGYFTAGTIFLIVVDPGVGSQRQPIAVQAGDYIFVAPDNGVLSYTLAHFDAYRAVALTNRSYQSEQVSYTFHGRDIFAPAAAHLANGVELEAFGGMLPEITSLPLPQLQIETGHITGEIVQIDHFGNAMTSIGKMRWAEQERLVLEAQGKAVRIPTRSTRLRIHNETIAGIAHAFHEVPRGQPLVQVDSNGYLEIAVNQGNAAQRLGISIGDVVVLNYMTETDLLAES